MVHGRIPPSQLGQDGGASLTKPLVISDPHDSSLLPKLRSGCPGCPANPVKAQQMPSRTKVRGTASLLSRHQTERRPRPTLLSIRPREEHSFQTTRKLGFYPLRNRRPRNTHGRPPPERDTDGIVRREADRSEHRCVPSGTQELLRQHRDRRWKRTLVNGMTRPLVEISTWTILETPPPLPGFCPLPPPL